MAFFSPFTSIYHWVASSIIVVLLKVALDSVLSLRTAFAKIRDCPGRQLLWIHPFTPMALMLSCKFPRPSMGGYAGAKFSFHKLYGATSLASVTLSAAWLHFWLGDAEAIRIISSDRHTFQKDVAQYEVLNIFGENLVSSEGLDWKRHRLVAMSAFSEANVASVWAETMRVVDEWFEQLDATGSVIPMDIMQPITQVTLLIIASAGFGKRLSLTPDSSAELPPGCKLTFQSAVVNSVNNVIFRAIVPKWFYQFSRLIKVPYLSSRAMTTQLAFDDLRIHMLDLVASARAEITSGKRSDAAGAALLWNLVEANMHQDGDSKRLTDAELLSDIFTFLFAGHETVAHTLSFAFTLLAIFPDRQQKLYEEVTRVWPADMPVIQLTTNYKDHMKNLVRFPCFVRRISPFTKIHSIKEYTLACIRETLRLFPAAPRMPKVVRKDTILPGTYFNPGSGDKPSVETGKFSMAIPKGSVVCMDVWAMHLNTLYWGEDAEEFRPERFIDTESYQWPRNAYMPFSGGQRSCIGQRFATAEMTGIIASVVRRYRILVPDDLVTMPLEKQKRGIASVEVRYLTDTVEHSRQAVPAILGSEQTSFCPFPTDISVYLH